MSYDFSLVDVFAREAFGGKQVAVFTQASRIPEAHLQCLARELNLPEVAFVLPASEAGHTRRIRIFTPAVELSYASHPTLGAAAVLAHEGVVDLIQERARLRLEIGRRIVTVDVASSEEWPLSSHLLFTPQVEPSTATPRPEDLAAILCLKRIDIADAWFATLGLPMCFVQLWDRQMIDRASPDPAAWMLHTRHANTPPLFIFAGDCSDGGRIYARMFAPALGLDEDPATVSACATLVTAMARRSKRKSGTFRLDVTQGVALGRASEITAAAALDAGQVASVSVGGPSSIVGHGSITASIREC